MKHLPDQSDTSENECESDETSKDQQLINSTTGMEAIDRNMNVLQENMEEENSPSLMPIAHVLEMFREIKQEIQQQSTRITPEQKMELKQECVKEVAVSVNEAG